MKRGYRDIAISFPALADLYADIRDEMDGYELVPLDCPDLPRELPDIELLPPIKKLGPNLLGHFLMAFALWGDDNAARYHDILEWEFKHRRHGENSPAWQGGKSFEPYCPRFNSELKESVREKFGRICLLCGKPESENCKKLCVHHVDYDKGQGCNGKAWKLVPLCSVCHTKTNNDREFWEQKIMQLLEERWS